MLLLLNMMMILFLMKILFMLNMFFYKKTIKIREKNSEIECGFSMMNKFNLPFSIQFFYISILFLIFDVEIALILPMIQKLFPSMMNTSTLMFLIILIILLIGLYIEWWNNLIKWMK